MNSLDITVQGMQELARQGCKDIAWLISTYLSLGWKCAYCCSLQRADKKNAFNFERHQTAEGDECAGAGLGDFLAAGRSSDTDSESCQTVPWISCFVVYGWLSHLTLLRVFLSGLSDVIVSDAEVAEPSEYVFEGCPLSCRLSAILAMALIIATS